MLKHCTRCSKPFNTKKSIQKFNEKYIKLCNDCALIQKVLNKKYLKLKGIQ